MALRAKTREALQNELEDLVIERAALMLAHGSDFDRLDTSDKRKVQLLNMGISLKQDRLGKLKVPGGREDPVEAGLRRFRAIGRSLRRIASASTGHPEAEAVTAEELFWWFAAGAALLMIVMVALASG